MSKNTITEFQYLEDGKTIDKAWIKKHFTRGKGYKEGVVTLVRDMFIIDGDSLSSIYDATGISMATLSKWKIEQRWSLSKVSNDRDYATDLLNISEEFVGSYMMCKRHCINFLSDPKLTPYSLEKLVNVLSVVDTRVQLHYQLPELLKEMDIINKQ